MQPFEARPLPLTRVQRLLFAVTAAAVALTRFVAVSATLWDWDEVQFALAVEEFDPADYRPHPPGFPLFIALAKLVRPFAASDFRALQTITVVAAMALFPLLFFLCRELRFPFATCYSGSLLAVFLPTVWFYGGTAFSDIPSLALTVAACALLLRGVRDRRSLVAGAALLGLAAAIRPQALLLGCVPALVVTWKRRRDWRALTPAIAMGASIIAVAYAGAALASSSADEYLAAGRKLRDYLRQVDSFLSPGRPPLSVLAELFFIRALSGGMYGVVVVIAAAAGVVVAWIRREGRVALLVAIFFPFQIFAWLMLDYHSVTRYGVTFAPMYAILAAAAATGISAWVPGLGRGGAVAVILFAAAIARWTYPALNDARRDASPPVLASQWIRKNIPPSRPTYVHGSMIPFGRYFLRDHDIRYVDAPRDLDPLPPLHDAVVLTETPSPVMSARRFVRARGRLFDIARQRYFEVTVIPAEAWAEFGEGWYGAEWHGEPVWIWMGTQSVTRLPPVAGPASLTLRVEPALEKGAPVVEVRLNGALIDRFAVEGVMERTWSVSARADAWNELVLTADRTVNPAREGLGADTRDLSLRLLGYDWRSAARPYGLN